jgi:hypothetical protein
MRNSIPVRLFAAAVAFALLLAGCFCDSSPAQCGPYGCCPCQNGQCYVAPQVPPKPHMANRPRPRATASDSTWRYAAPRNHYRSVVRVQTVDRDGSRSLGSGVAIRWSDRLAILTARHVVTDARRIWVRGAGPWIEARIVRTDPVWDVAALSVRDVSQFVPIKIAWRDTGHPDAGDPLESCGFGPDDRLAVNRGQFLGYRAAPSAPRTTDWLVLTGHARQGDSGGPVFNRRHELVGILWGCADNQVVATQCGRLHLFLAQTFGVTQQSSGIVAAKPASRNSSPQRKVSPPHIQTKRPVELVARTPLLPLCRPRTPEPTPAPQIIVRPDPYTRSIDRKMDLLIENKQQQKEAAKRHTGANSLIVFLVVGACVALGFIIYFGSQKS